MPSYLPKPKWDLLYGLFVAMLLIIDAALFYTLLSDYLIPAYLEPYDEKATQLLVTFVMVTGLLVIVAPLYIRRLVLQRSRSVQK